MGFALSAYLDLLCQGNNIVFIQVHDAVYVYLWGAISMGIGECIAVRIEVLRIYGGLFAETQEDLALYLGFRYQGFEGLPVWLEDVRNESGRVSGEF